MLLKLCSQAHETIITYPSKGSRLARRAKVSDEAELTDGRKRRFWIGEVFKPSRGDADGKSPLAAELEDEALVRMGGGL